VIGFVSGRSPNESTGVVAAFRRGLGETGFVEGQNLVIAFRWAEGRYHQLPALAGELVGLRVGVLVAAGGTASALVAKAATATIPIVFTAVGDPVGTGLVASLSRPEANVTGMSALAGTAIAGKRIELLKSSVPTAAGIAFLVNPSSPNSVTERNEALAAANTLGIPVHVLNASTEGDLEAAFASVVRLRAGGLVVAIEAFFDSQRDRLVVLSARHAVPTLHGSREAVVAGGLMSYGPNIADSYRWAGVYTGRILKGEKPTDLPVMQPTKLDLVINLRTAKALGLEIPPTLLALADEVIE
jgi:putative ABC transport system substrate-binding protein